MDKTKYTIGQRFKTIMVKSYYGLLVGFAGAFQAEGA